MLAQLHRYANGYVAVPIALALRERGAFSGRRPVGNQGHIATARRLLGLIGWITNHTADFGVVDVSPIAVLPHDLLAAYSLDFAALVRGSQSDVLDDFLRSSLARGGGLCAAYSDHLDGAFAVPLLIALHQLGGISDVTAIIASRPLLSKWFCHHEYGQSHRGGFELTEVGRYMVERAMVNGVVASYAPLLRNAESLLFGDCGKLFAAEGDERHVDRSLNVVASGFQHERYFDELTRLLTQDFREESAPKVVVDMGCGDGSLLQACHVAFSQQNHRVQLVGADLNDAALQATASKLSEYGAVVLHGDVNDPASLAASLIATGFNKLDEIVHVRSFLDHDRTYRAPKRLQDLPLWNRMRWPIHAVDRSGQPVPPAAVIQGLVEHFEGWRSIAGANGLLILEVHSGSDVQLKLEPELTNAIHFEAIHSWTSQQLVPADAFLLAAAAAGFLPRVGCSRRYPRTTPHPHITLNWFEPVPFRIRPAMPADLPALVGIETACWPEKLRLAKEQLRRRIAIYPQGCLVAEYEGCVVSSVYSQRVGAPELLRNVRFDTMSEQHSGEGSTLHLLSLNVDPSWQNRGLGDRLLHFMLQLASVTSGVNRVAGITRCRDFPGGSAEYADYVRQENAHGYPIDPIICFHVSHGARIDCIVPGFRKEDDANAGNGVLVVYDLHRDKPSLVTKDVLQSEVALPRGGVERILEALGQITGESPHSFAVDVSLAEQGLDSLQLQELGLILERITRRRIGPVFFFNHSTPSAIAVALGLSSVPPAGKSGA